MNGRHAGGHIKMNALRWAKRQLLVELREMRAIGLACNVQQWRPGLAGGLPLKANVAECRAKRAEAQRLLEIAINAVRKA